MLCSSTSSTDNIYHFKDPWVTFSIQGLKQIFLLYPKFLNANSSMPVNINCTLNLIWMKMCAFVAPQHTDRHVLHGQVLFQSEQTN